MIRSKSGYAGCREGNSRVQGEDVYLLQRRRLANDQTVHGDPGAMMDLDRVHCCLKIACPPGIKMGEVSKTDTCRWTPMSGWP
jgi:hypothetical protein